MRHQPSLTVLLVVACVLSAGTSWADDLLTPVAQSRRVYAYASMECGGSPLEEDVNEVLAPDYLPFVAMVDADVYYHTGDCEAHADASQNSQIHPDRLVAFGGSGAYADAGSSWQYGDAGAVGISEFDVTFEITEELPYRLNGSLAVSQGSASCSVALLDGNGNYIHSFSADPTLDFDVLDILDPGQYRLMAQSWTSAGFSSRSNSGNYEVTLEFEQPVAAVMDPGQHSVEPTTWGRIKAQMR